ncbi:MAG TPA: flagellar biosynthesis protein FlhF, partial [Castellaniella sp.]|nr:flagellar biosynthesis protein FlhF [Castellaniella sp.]
MPHPIREGNNELLGAIGDLKGSLESRIDELLWGNQLRRSPQAITLFQTLLRFGFSTALLRAMLKRMPEQATPRAAFQWARNELGKHLPVLDAEDALWQPGLALALVGPTGVGKTTT